jgi:hypothetical protein
MKTRHSGRRPRTTAEPLVEPYTQLRACFGQSSGTLGYSSSVDSLPPPWRRLVALMTFIGLVVVALDAIGVYEPRGPLGAGLLIIGAVGFFAIAMLGVIELIRADREESP